MKIFKNWGVHNIVAHPLMQLLIYMRLPVLGLLVHNATLPPAPGDRKGGNRRAP